MHASEPERWISLGLNCSPQSPVTAHQTGPALFAGVVSSLPFIFLCLTLDLHFLLASSSNCFFSEFVVIHNGIITNYKDLRKFLVRVFPLGGDTLAAWCWLSPDTLQTAHPSQKHSQELGETQAVTPQHSQALPPHRASGVLVVPTGAYWEFTKSESQETHFVPLATL